MTRAIHRISINLHSPRHYTERSQAAAHEFPRLLAPCRRIGVLTLMLGPFGAAANDSDPSKEHIMTKRWISTVGLARDQGISWMDAEQIIREETSRIRDRGPIRWWFSLIYLTGMLWLFAGARWMFPELGRLALFGVELAGFVVMMGTYFAPRLLARDAILDRARKHATARAIQNS